MKSVILLSGGMDSAVLLAKVKNEIGGEIHCVGVDYGQRHVKELWFADQLARYYGTRMVRLILPRELMEGSALTGMSDVPKDLHYEDPDQGVTVVPGRNLILLSLAIAHAVKIRANTVYIAAHAGDRAVYKDCGPGFLAAVDHAAWVAYDVHVLRPFLDSTKRDIVQIGKVMHVPFDLTWSCYEGVDKPCGRCGACVERQEALK